MAAAPDNFDDARIVMDLDQILGDVETAQAVSPKASPAAKPKPKPDPSPIYLDDDGIVTQAPESQVRNVAVIYTTDLRAACISMLAFLDQVALEVSKRPFYLRKIFLAEFRKGAEIEGLLRAAKLAEASAAIVLLPPAAKNIIKPMQKAFNKSELLFHCICSDQILDRKRASDLVLDLMLQRRG